MIDQKNAYSRGQWIKSIEKEEPGILFGCPRHCRILYSEARQSYINGQFFACIIIVASAIEALLAAKIPFEYFPEDLKNNHRRFNLYRLTKIVRAKSIITNDLADTIEQLRWVRHGIVHANDPTFDLNLGFKLTSYRGTGSTSRGASFESPTGEPMLPPSPQEGAELGINTFLQTLKQIKSSIAKLDNE